ncbi:MAG TPA: cytochrome c [Steroidobacteraceae bacterium]|jgi:mono/diheme cytochrome c family protein|nr:cytochrome c [Steroidobacteraceae bacterium]
MRTVARVALTLAVSFALVGAGRAADLGRGKQVFQIWCAGCHEPLPGPSYAPPAGTYVLNKRYHGTKPAALEQRTDLTAAYVKAIVRAGRNMMPPTRKTEVSDTDLDALAAYLAGNNPR